MQHTQQSFVLPLYERSAQRHLMATGVQEGASLAAIAGVASIAALFTTTDKPVMVAEEGEAPSPHAPTAARPDGRGRSARAHTMTHLSHVILQSLACAAAVCLANGRFFATYAVPRAHANAAYEHWANSQFPRGLPPLEQIMAFVVRKLRLQTSPRRIIMRVILRMTLRCISHRLGRLRQGESAIQHGEAGGGCTFGRHCPQKGHESDPRVHGRRCRVE